MNREELKKLVLNTPNDFELGGIIRNYVLYKSEEKVSNFELVEFGRYYRLILNSVYETFIKVDPIIGEKFILYPFILGDKPKIDIPNNIEEAELLLNKLTDNQLRDDIRIFEKNCIFLYKANKKSNWTRYAAIQDADATFMDLVKQGK